MGFSTTIFTSPPNENFVCSICHDVFDNPKSCRCGHTFCRDCLDEALATDERCPICRAVIRKKAIIQNTVLRSLIGDLEIRCQGSDTDDGCEWTGKVASYESHRKHDCAMQIIKCEVSGCDFQCLRKDMVRHITSKEGIKSHVDCLLMERIEQIRAEVEEEKCAAEERMCEAIAKLESLEKEIVAKEKQRIHDELHFHLTASCRQWLLGRPAILRDFVIYRPPTTTTRISSLLCGIPGPKRTPWEGGLFPVHITWTGLYVPPTCKYPRHFLHVNVYTDGKISASFLDPDEDWCPTISIPELLFGIQQHLAHPHPDRAAQTKACDSFLGNSNILYNEEVRKQAKRFSSSVDFLSIASKAFNRSFSSWVAVDDSANNEGCEWLECCPADGTQCECPYCEQEQEKGSAI